MKNKLPLVFVGDGLPGELTFPHRPSTVPTNNPMRERRCISSHKERDNHGGPFALATVLRAQIIQEHLWADSCAQTHLRVQKRIAKKLTNSGPTGTKQTSEKIAQSDNRERIRYREETYGYGFLCSNAPAFRYLGD
jgi:hypothetical protein